MMAYLTRPGFNGGGAVSNRTVLPKRKPQAEVKKRKKINYEKIKQYLGKESQELIERELGFAVGGGVNPAQLKQRFMQLVASIQDAEDAEIPSIVAQAKQIRNQIDDLNRQLAPDRQIKIVSEGLDFDNPLLDAAKIAQAVGTEDIVPETLTKKNPILKAIVPDFPKGIKGTLADPEEKEDLKIDRRVGVTPGGEFRQTSMRGRRTDRTLGDYLRRRELFRNVDLTATEGSFAEGGDVDTPKRGLVDEPGSYSGEKVIKTYSPGFTRLEDYQDGTPRYRVNLVRTTNDGKKVSIKEKFKNYKNAKKAFDDFNIKNPLTILGKKDYIKLLPKFKTLINKSKKYPSQASIRKKLDVPRSTFNSLLDLYLEEGNILPENRFPGIETSLAGGKRQQIIDTYKANKTLNLQDLATKFKVDRTTIRRTLKNEGLRDPSEFQNISDPEKKTKTKSRYKTLKKITDVPYESSILGNDYVNLHHGDSKKFNVTTRTLGYAPPRVNSFLLPKLETYLNNLYDQREDLLKKKPKDLVRKLEEINIKGMNLVSNPQVQGYLNFKIMDPKTLKMSDFGMDIATTIDPADLLKGKNIKDLSDFDKGIIELNRKEVMVAQKGAALPSNVVYGRGGPQPGKGQRSVYGKQAQKIVQDVERVSAQQIERELTKAVEELPSGAQGKICNALKAGGLSTTCAEAIRQDPLKTASIIEKETARLPSNVGRKALQAARLAKNVFGPLAIAGEVAIEGGFMADKYMRTGMPMKQVFGESILNLALGPKLRVDVEAERAKEFAKGEDFAMAERGRRKAPFLAQGEYADRLRREARVAEMQQKFPGISEEDLTKNVKALYPDIDLSMFPMQELKQQVDDAAKLEYFADNFRQEKAGGGIAKLAGKESGPAPESGPNSQGLAFFMKRGR